jgi:type II secretory pathway component PulF
MIFTKNQHHLEIFFAKLTFNTTFRQRTWKKLAAQAKHGMSLDLSIYQMYNRSKAKRSSVALIFSNALDALARGHNLGVCFSEFITPEEVSLISSGQVSGKVSEGLELAANLLSAKKNILKAIISALAYPIFLISMSLLALSIVSFVVMPKFALLSDPTKWQGLASVFYHLTSFVSSKTGVFCLILMLLIIASSLVSLPIWHGKSRLHFENIPPWSIYRMTIGAVWLFTISTLMKSGMQITHILENMIQSEYTTPYLYERVLAISIENGRGKNLGESLYETGYNFPDEEVIDDLRVYATLPNFHLRLHDIANEWMSNGIDKIKDQARIVNICAILFITTFVCFMVFAIGSLQSQLIPGGF